MSASNSARARQLFEEVVDLDANERDALLAERCAGDAELQRLVLELLSKDADAERDQFLARTPTADLTGAHIGRYRVLRAIGSGGMGTVYLAEQDQPRRNVALKVLQPIFRSSSVLRRFTVESEILARLQHPGIAQVFDAGVHEFAGDGFRLTLPWYALEYIEGATTLTQYANRAKLDVPARVRLLADVAAAVHHAHQKGVIHRDLKPANLLVAQDGRAKVIDFGVARVATTEGASTLHTVSGELLGTVRYMAPEQLAGDSDAVDTRTDVYALGVILFELLTGKPPLDLDGKSVTDAARIVRDETPKRLRALDATLPQDLEWICAKALEKEPARRFASAGEFVADLERFLAGEPALSGPPSAAYRVSVFVRRHRVLVGALSAVIVALAIGLVVALFAVAKANREETRANDEATAAKASEQRAKIAETAATNEAARAQAAETAAQKDARIAFAISSLLKDSYAQANPENKGRELKVVDALESTASRMFDALGDMPEVIPPVADEIAKIYQSLGDTDRAIEILETAAEKTRGAGLTESRDHVLTITNIVELAALVGRFDDSSALLDEAEPIALRVLDAKDPIRLRISRQRATLLQRHGKLAEAIPALRGAYAQHRDALGPGDIDTLLVHNDLAIVLSGLEQKAEAAAILTDIVKEARTAFGDDNTWTLSFRANLAAILRDLGRFDEAVAELEAIIAVQAARVGVDNPMTLSTRQSLAQCHCMNGDVDRGIDEYQAVLADLARVSGDGSASTVMAASHLTGELNKVKRYAEAVAVARKHLDASATTLTPDHTAVVGLGGTLGYTYLELGQLDDAEPLLLNAHARFADRFGRTSIYTRQYAAALVRLYESRGDTESAAKYAPESDS